ncbi:MAG: type IV secretory system conjugative DNA transfer family protein [Chromatiales bacterium]|jgi:defect-in-organelle-trafficking protein DotC
MWVDLPPEPPAQIVQTECAKLADIVLTLENPRTEQASSSDSAGFMEGLREKAIRTEALTNASQFGLSYRTLELSTLMEQPEVRGALDGGFNFTALQTDWQVIPPVISEAGESFSRSTDGQSARRAMVTWKILEPAKLVTAPPNWREYLLREINEPSFIPTPALLPLDDHEREIWKSALCEGWAAGYQQASLTFADDLSLLVRDYTGMLRFRALIKLGVVSEPVVSEGRLGVTVDSNRVNVDDRTYLITHPVRFRDVDDWVPVITRPLLFGGDAQ